MAIIQCPECGKEISDQEKFCSYCGFPLKESVNTNTHTWRCVNCGDMTDSAICSHCGKSSTEREVNVSSAENVIVCSLNDNKSLPVNKSKKVLKKIILSLICSVTLISIIAILSITIILPNMDYNHAKELLQNEDYVAAFAAFEKLGDYKDAKKQAENAQKNIRYTLSKEKIISIKTGIGSTNIGFGENTPYTWEVLTIEDGKALLLSTTLVNNLPYHKQDSEVTWEDCDLREYLNNDFYKKFTDEERAMIIPVQNDNSKNEAYGTSGGEKTTDKIFLLSIEELEKYCENLSDLTQDSSWWLRSPGKDNAHAACVGETGTVFADGFYVERSGNGVRPALWINVSSTDKAEKIVKNFQFSTQDGKTTIPFGGYTWQLLDIQNNKALFIMEDIIELKPYHTSSQTTWWSESDIRNYLNGEFYNKFSEQEKLKIAQTQVITPSHNGNSGGYPSLDKIFLLSMEEVEQYFPTVYGEDQFGNKNRVAKYQNQPYWWWLRQPGFSHEQAIIVYADGTIEPYGANINSVLGVRPAMWLKLINTEYSQTKVSVNQNFLSDIGSTYSEMKRKYGEVTETAYLDGGRYFVFETGSGMYFFEAPNGDTRFMDENGNMKPDIEEDAVCFLAQANITTFFNDFEGLKPIVDVEQELGVSIECFEDEMEGGYRCSFDYKSYSISISLGDSETVISEDSTVRVERKE